MYCYIKAEDRVLSASVHSGLGVGNHVRLVGSTFPIVPVGSFVEKLALEAHEGLQAIAFLCRVDEPQRKGSGKTAYLDHTPSISSLLLLMWEEGDKVIAKADDDMSARELAMFNPFVRSGAEIMVVDARRRTVYFIGTGSSVPLDPEWVHKKVSGNALCEYIAKRKTLEELDATAESEIAARNEIAELRREIFNVCSEARAAQERCRIATDRADAIEAAFVRFATLTRDLLDQPLFSNRTVRFIARRFGLHPVSGRMNFRFSRNFGNDGTTLRHILAKSGEGAVSMEKLELAVRAEQYH